MKLEEVAEYVCHEVAIFKDIPRNEFPVINRAWLKQNEPISFECNVDRCGNHKLKVGHKMVTVPSDAKHFLGLSRIYDQFLLLIVMMIPSKMVVFLLLVSFSSLP
jgi:hypothetical protein